VTPLGADGSRAAALNRPGDPDAVLRDIVRTYTELAIEGRDLIIVYMSEVHHLPAAERGNRRRNQRMYVDELTHALCQACPELPAAEAALRARATFALINEVISVDRMVRRPAIRAELTAFALAALRPSTH
jgi:hypothetical protein